MATIDATMQHRAVRLPRVSAVLVTAWLVTMLGLGAWALVPTALGWTAVVVPDHASPPLSRGDVVMLDRPVDGSPVAGAELLDGVRLVVPYVGLPLVWWDRGDLARPIALTPVAVPVGVAWMVLVRRHRARPTAPARRASRRPAASGVASLTAAVVALTLTGPLRPAMAAPWVDTATNGTNAVAATVWTSYYSTVAGDSPSGWWKLNEATANNTVTATNGSSGTYENGHTGVTSATTNMGGASNFNGSNQCGKMGDQFDFANKQSFSVEFWMWRSANSANGAYPRLVSKLSGNGGWAIALNPPNDANANQFHFGRTDNAGTATYIGSKGVAPSLNAWHHVVATYNGTTNVMAFYQDGDLRETGTSSGNLTDSGEPLSFGCMGSNQSYYNGNLDEVALYNVALTPRQVRAHYQAGLANL